MAWAGRRRSFFFGLTRSQPPSGASSHAWQLSASSALKIALDLVAHLGVLDGDDDLDPVVEVARHQVGAAEQIRLLVVRPRSSTGGCARGSARERCERGCSRSDPRRRGSSVQIARTMMSISTPAWDALYSSSTISVSVRLFIFIRICARLPVAAASGDFADVLDELLAQVERGDQDLAEALRAGRSR